MAVPSFLSGAFSHTLLSACTDVQAIMDQMSADLVGLGWTQTVGVSGDTTQEFTTPVGATAAEFFVVNCVRISATDLQVIITDGFGQLFCYPTHSHIYIDALGTNVSVFGGVDVPYFMISANRATPESIAAWQTDKYPDAHGNPMPRWVCLPCRTSAGALSSNNWANCLFKSPADTSYSTVVSYYLWRQWYAASGTAQSTFSGAMLVHPIEYQADGYWMGRLPNALLIDDSYSIFSEYVIPIDYDGVTFTTGTFRVIAEAVQFEQRMAIRVA